MSSSRRCRYVQCTLSMICSSMRIVNRIFQKVFPKCPISSVFPVQTDEKSLVKVEISAIIAHHPPQSHSVRVATEAMEYRQCIGYGAWDGMGVYSSVPNPCNPMDASTEHRARKAQGMQAHKRRTRPCKDMQAIRRCKQGKHKQAEHKQAHSAACSNRARATVRA